MSVYILHFVIPISKRASHYVGFAVNVEGRLHHHRNGTGARLTQVAVERGIDIQLARVFDGADRTFERQLKDCHKVKPYCPICHPGTFRQYHPKKKEG